MSVEKKTGAAISGFAEFIGTGIGMSIQGFWYGIGIGAGIGAWQLAARSVDFLKPLGW